jgi:hypothetical protein
MFKGTQRRRGEAMQAQLAVPERNKNTPWRLTIIVCLHTSNLRRTRCGKDVDERRTLSEKERSELKGRETLD